MTQASNNDGGFVIFSGRQTWYSNSTETQPQPKAKAKAQRVTNKNRASAKSQYPVIYPIFEECMECTEDPYWKSMMQKASTGVWPRSFRYQNGLLTYRARSKTTECQIPTEDPIQTLNTVRQFMMTAAGISSPMDIEMHKIQIQDRLADYTAKEITSWSLIRTTQHRTILIGLFVEKIGNEWNLDLHQRQALDNYIKMGVLAGYLNNENIHMTGNTISSIDALIRDPTTGQFRIDVANCKIKQQKVNYRKSGSIRTGSLDYGLSSDDPVSADVENGIASVELENRVYTDSSVKAVSVVQMFEKFLDDLSKKNYSSQNRNRIGDPSSESEAEL
jgi:hypothetical protein